MAIKSEIVKFIEDASRAMPKGQSVVDVGCGSRAYENLFAGHKYVGIDVVESGRENKKPDMFFDGKNIPLADQSVDMILSTEVFEHVEDLDFLIKDISRVLKAKGSLLITVPFIWGEHEMPYDFRRFTSVGVIDFLKKNGFTVKKIEQGTIGLAAFMNLGMAEIRHGMSNSGLNGIKKKIAIMTLKMTGAIFSVLGIKMKRIYIRNILLAEKNS